MLDKVNVTRIVGDHIGTLRDNRTGRLSIPDLILFFFVPGVIAGVILYFYGSLETQLDHHLCYLSIYIRCATLQSSVDSLRCDGKG